MVRDHDNDQFKGYAYVEFKTREDLERALSYDGCVRFIYLSYDLWLYIIYKAECVEQI